MYNANKHLIILVAVLFFSLVLSKTLYAIGNNWINGELRVDQSTIQNAKRYRIQLLSSELPTTGNGLTYTTAWMSVRVENSAQGFSQVGLITYPSGIRWFAYSEKGMTCLRGTSHWSGLGCRGNINDLVSLNQWHFVELYKATTENFWRARIYDSNGNAYDVGTIPSSSNTIYRATVSFEEGFSESDDPQVLGKFYFYRPEYYSSAWNIWPYSATNPAQQSYGYLARSENGTEEDANFCPSAYAATPYLYYDPWYWYAGTGGTLCGWLFPPLTYDNAGSGITYTGSWTHNLGVARAYNGSSSYTGTTGDKATFTMNPTTSITRLYSKSPGSGITTVKLNGNQVYSGAESATPKRRQVAKTWSATGTTAIEVSNTSSGAGFTDVDAFIVDIPRLPVGTYDNYHYGMRFIGSWNHNGNASGGAYNNTTSYTATSEDAVSFTFEGSKIGYFFSKSQNQALPK